LPAAAILMYHRIASHSGKGRRGTVSPENFNAHMRTLRDDGYAVLPLRELLVLVASGELSDRSVVITIDDGYADVRQNAAPVLADYGYPATLFVTGATLSGCPEFWWDTLDRIFSSELPLPNQLRLRLPSGGLELPTDTQPERSRALQRLCEALYTLRHADRVKVMGEISSWSAVPGVLGDATPMTSDDLLTLTARSTIDIGSHTMNHVWLPAETADEQGLEIAESKAALEKLLARPVVAFAYPFGGHDPASVDLVRKAGYLCAVTTQHGLADGGSSPFMLPRIEMRDSDARVFGEQLRRMFEERVAATELR
jgi:peptidoglycan/xylan/chitin deacetylase (PgdA/CDA1 family)